MRVFLSVLALAIGAGAAMADWPRFRGPGGDGRAEDAEGLPLRWSRTENVAWRTPLEGEGWSSPVVHDGRVFLTAAVDGESEGDYSLRALCLRASDGAQGFDVEVFQQDGDTAPNIHTKNSHASPTPIVADGRLYVHFGHQGTACLSLEGKILWRNRTLDYPPVHGNGGSPILVGDSLIFSCDGATAPFVVALDRNTGEELWRTSRSEDALKKFSFTTPTALEVDGQTQIVSPASDMVAAYDPATGREIWKVRYDGYSLIPKPVFGDGLLYVPTGYNTPSLLAIRVDGEGDVTDTHVAWIEKRSVPHTPSPLLVGDELYLVSDRGVASCLDAKTGAVHWRERLGGNYSASPLYADGRVYFQSEDGVGTVILAGKQFRLLATNPLEERTLASYAVSDGALFIRSDEALYRIGAPGQVPH